MFHTPRLTRSTRKGANTSLQKSVKRSPTKQESYLLQTSNVTVQQRDSFPELIKRQLAKRGSFQFGSIDCISGFMVVNFEGDCFLWNYQLSTEPIKLTMPQNATRNEFCFSSIIPASNFQGDFGFMTQSVGMVILSSGGTFRYWRDVLCIDDYQDLRLEIDEIPTSLMFCDHAGVFIGMETGSVIRIVNEGNSLNMQILTRPSSIQKSLFGFITGSVPGNSILKTTSERLLAVVPGSTDFERETQDIYILSNLYLQKWIVDFHSKQELVAEMNLNGIISGQLDIGDFEILDMDFGKQNRLVFLLLEVNTGRHSLVICQESVQVDTLEILAVKNLTMAFEGENAGNLSLCNGGPVALVSFPNRLYVKYIFDESDFEQVIPLKKSDLVGCSVDRSRVDLESIDSKSISALCCLGTGVMDVHVNITNLVRSARKNEILQKDNLQDEFYVKLEQAIFFSNSEDEINPIFFDLGDIPSQIDDQCIELAHSILRGKNSLLKNTLDESEYLVDALTRLENIPKVLSQRGILNSVSRSTLEELMSAIEKLEVLKSWREHHNSIYNLMDNSLIKLLIRSEQVIARLLEAKKEDPAERSFFRFGAEDIPLALEYVQNQLCTPKTDFDTPEEMFSTIDTSILFTLVYNAVYGVQDNQAIVPEYDGGQWISNQSLLNAFQTQFELNIRVIEKLQYQGNSQVAPSLQSLELLSLGSEGVVQYLLRLHCDMSRSLLRVLLAQRNTVERKIESLKSYQEYTDRYYNVQGKAVELMRRYGLEDIAFSTLESFNDMESLVSLTFRSPNSEFRLRKYIRMFKEKFSNILFQQLFTAKKYKEMMDLRSEFGFYLRSYLEQNNIAFLSWIIDLEQKQYQEASLKLINLSKTEPYLEKEDLLVSISKLADLQSKLIQTQNLETEMMNDDNFNSILDLIEFQRTIFDTFQQEINFGVLKYDQVHATVGQLMERFYSKNLNRKVLTHLLRNTLTLLLEQKKVPLSHLLDLMIFRSSADEGPNVFKNVIETAVEHKEDLGDMFTQFLHRFWRQVLLSDHFQDLDLHKSGISDEMRSETLQRTNTFDVLLYLCEQQNLEVILNPSGVKHEIGVFPIVYRDILTHEQLESLDQEELHEQAKLDTLVKEVNLDQIFATLKSMAVAHISVSDTEML